jgi:hypothetical protein
MSIITKKIKNEKTILFNQFIVAFLILFFISSNIFAETFIFNPPDNTVYKQTVDVTKTKDLGALGTQTEKTKFETKVTIKKTQSGYLIVSTPISIVMTKNDKEINNPILSLLNKITFNFELDTEGFLLSIEGFDQLEKLMNENLPRHLVHAIAPVLNKETLSGKEAAEWNGRIEKFINRNIKSGDVWTDTDIFQFPNGESLIFYSGIKFEKITDTTNLNLIKILFTFNSEPEKLKNFFSETITNIYKKFGIYKKKIEIPNGISITGSGIRVIDPKTMLIYSEEINQIMTMPMNIPNYGKINSTMHEKRVYTFSYQ